MEICKKYIIFCIMIIVFVLTVIKAVAASMTWDEAYTYIEYVKLVNFFDVNVIKDLYYNSLANNHWLNTFLINVVERLTGIEYNEFLIRLPSLSFFVIYLCYVWLLFKKNYISFLTVILLCGNYYLNEFYSLARGYGMASTLILIACYFYIKWRESGYEASGQLMLSATMLMIGTFANTIVFMVYPAFGLLFLFNLIKVKRLKNFLLSYWWYVVLFTIGSFLMLKYHFIVSAEDLPLYVGNGNFYESVICSYIHMFVNRPWMDLIMTGGLLVCIMGCIFILKSQIIKCDFFLMLIIFIVTNIVMCHLTGKGYMTGRVALPFYCFVVISVSEVLFKAYREILHMNNIVSILLVAGVFVFCFASYKNKYNPNATIDWGYDCGRREEVLAGYISLSLESDDALPVNKKKKSMADVFYGKKYADILGEYTDRFYENYQ